MSDDLDAEINYYSGVLADPTLLDKAVVVDGVLSSGSVIDQDGVPHPFPPEYDRSAYCVPVGGTRRGGYAGIIARPEALPTLVDALRAAPGFPNPRVDDQNCVFWGDDLPEVPDCEEPARRLHMDWLYGHHYGYSLTAIVFQLGRTAAMAVCPDFLKREREDAGGEQIRNFRRAA